MLELIRRVNLPELAKFNETRGIEPGQFIDLALATVNNSICCYTPVNDVDVAVAYRTAIGKTDGDFVIIPTDNPIQAVLQLNQPNVVPLVFHSATDPVLFQRMFVDGPKLGQLLMSHIYTPELAHQSPALHAVGIANQGLDIIKGLTVPQNELLIRQIDARRKAILGEKIPTNGEFRGILQSPKVHKIIAHVLGPDGTNISQAMRQYIKALGVEEKTDLVIHPSGIEPMEYAKIAAQQIERGVIPIHMECAVYYEMGRMFDERSSEVVFADHHYMPLDAMQLASKKEISELISGGVMRIATHPSPKPLINPWVNAGKAQWIKATSNSAAAEMVMNAEVDACVTTASSLKAKDGLMTRHVFGSPIMLFTIATPLNQQQLKTYL